MLKMINGCKIYGAQQLQEEYEVSEFVINANVNVDKIEEVLRHFIVSQKSLLFFYFGTAIK